MEAGFIKAKITSVAGPVPAQTNTQKYIFAQICPRNTMESRLIVKNFGPIKHVDLVLKNVNVFIGPQSTGKSALAKLYTIFKAPRKFFYKGEADKGKLTLNKEKAFNELKEALREYNIHSFLRDDTEIIFESQLHNISYKNEVLEYTPKLLDIIAGLEKLIVDFDDNREEIITRFKNLGETYIYFKVKSDVVLLEKEDNTNELFSTECFDSLNSHNCNQVLALIKETERELSTNTALYIPSERNFINIIENAALNLILNKVPIPQHVLSFGAELEKLEVKEIDLGFIQNNLTYKIVDGESRIFIDNDTSIKLSEAASGIQSVVPLLRPILNNASIQHNSFVIEEPELNLFPLAQYHLIQFLELKRVNLYAFQDIGTIHTYTTHSPYILSALNNLLYAYKVKSKLSQSFEDNNTFLNAVNFDRKKANELQIAKIRKIKKIVKAEIDPDDFTAYQINNGYATSIFNKEAGLIDDNFIDEASDKINEDFEKLMELLK